MRKRRFPLTKPELQAPWVVVLMAAGITSVCFTAVMGGLLESWTAAVLISASVAYVAWYIHAAHRRFQLAINELREILKLGEASADYARIYEILDSLIRFDGRIEKLLEFTERFILGQTTWSEYRAKMLESLEVLEGVPFLGRRP